MPTRRDFLKISALASGALFTPQFLQALGHGGLNTDGKKLIIIQLSGGCDGLNAFVPYRNDIYYKMRPRLAMDEVLELNDEIGLNAALKPLQALYDQGQFALINGVGYPNPNRSHFRSMDIWHTGSSSSEYLQTGWLGRYLDSSCKGCAAPHKVIEMADTLSLALKGTETNGLAVKNPHRLHKATNDPYIQALEKLASGSKTDNENLDYLYKTLTQTNQSTAYIYEATKVYRSKQTYPGSAFGKSLKMIAELICSGVETEVFYTSLSGFDTHINQKPTQARLFNAYATGVAALVRDLEQNNRLKDTLILTFSEFGRRVKQNASNGTDHGKANNLWLIGGGLRKPGIYNEVPDLAELDNGDLQWKVDFRQVYAEVLDNWMGADSKEILGGRSFDRLGIV
jgi:uncharacterized protein (DUF1501 family)